MYGVISLSDATSYDKVDIKKSQTLVACQNSLDSADKIRLLMKIQSDQDFPSMLFWQAFYKFSSSEN